MQTDDYSTITWISKTTDRQVRAGLTHTHQLPIRRVLVSGESLFTQGSHLPDVPAAVIIPRDWQEGKRE